MPEIELVEAIDTPAVLRGTVSASRWEGLVPGKGLSSADRKQNAKALQAAITYAAEHGKFLELEPGHYQVEEPAGLVLPASENGFVWRGSKASHIEQFANDAPVLTIGDVKGNAITAHVDLRGLRLSYHADQTANPGSSALRIGLMRNSIVENVAVLADYGPTGPRVRAHRGIEVSNASNAFGFFSNTIKDIVVGGAARHLIDLSLVGTGSVFQNVYLTQGVSGHPAVIGGEAFRLAGDADQYKSVFENMNIEWCITSTLMLLQNCRATTFLGCHIEGNRIHGHDPRVMQISSSQLNFSGLNILDLEVASPESSSGLAPQIFGFYGDCTLTGTNIHMSWSAPSRIKAPCYVCSPNRFNPSNQRQTVNIGNMTVQDVGGDNAQYVELEPVPDGAGCPIPKAMERYLSRQDGLSRVEGARIGINADMTVYAQLVNPYLEYPAALGTQRAVTLSNRTKASGEGATLKPMSGAVVTVRRNDGPGDAYALIVRNHDGTPLAALTSANMTIHFQFDGANWVVAA